MQRTTSNESGTSSNVTDITSRVGSLLGSLRNNEGLNLHRTQSNQSSQENSGNIYGVLWRGVIYRLSHIRLCQLFIGWQKIKYIICFVVRILKIRALFGLRVVQIESILFLKSKSERDGSNIQRLWNWMMNFQIDQTSIADSNSESFYAGSDSFRHWFQK